MPQVRHAAVCHPLRCDICFVVCTDFAAVNAQLGAGSNATASAKEFAALCATVKPKRDGLITKEEFVAFKLRDFDALTDEQLNAAIDGLQSQVKTIEKAHGHSHSGAAAAAHAHDGKKHGHGHAHAHDDNKAHGHGHAHDHDAADSRKKMKPVVVGTITALLTSHLSSKDGNELDVFFENTVARGAPGKALPVSTATPLQATVVVGGDSKPGGGAAKHTVTFDPAPAEERPAGEGESACSHFVAKTPFMAPTTTLASVTLNIPAPAGGVHTFVWCDFHAKTWAHHED